jgi:RNA polymerase sigma factor (sigma-70 family)
MSIPFDSALSETGSDTAGRQHDTHPSESSALLESFCAEFAPLAARYAMSIVRCWSDAEEIVQEAFCRMIQVGRDIENEAAGKAMLFAIVRNLAIDQLRKNGRRRFEAVDTSQIEKTKQSTDETNLERLEKGIQEGFKMMPNQWSDALQLKINAELSYDEIASVLNATHAQVRTWIYRARKQLEKDLRQQGLLGD